MANHGDSLLTGGASIWGGGVNGDCVIIQLENSKGTTAIDAKALEGLLAQQVQVQSSKQPRQVYEIGTKNHYIIDARPSGSGTISHLIGPNRSNLFDKLAGFSDVCTQTNLTIGAKDNCGCLGDGSPSVGGAVTFTDGILNSIQLSATANDYVVTSNLGFMFFDVLINKTAQLT